MAVVITRGRYSRAVTDGQDKLRGPPLLLTDPLCPVSLHAVVSQLALLPSNPSSRPTFSMRSLEHSRPVDTGKVIRAGIDILLSMVKQLHLSSS